LSEAAAALAHSVVHRPYAFVLFGAYLVVATWHLGRRRVLWMSVAGYAIAWASESASIRWGIPYGRYRYLEDALEGDLLVLGVPFFDSLSYTFLAYFGWGTALLLASPVVRRRGLDVQIAETLERRRSPRVLLLSAWLATWLDVVVDPVAARGERWFLGKIYAYAEPGVHHGVPLSNYAGWFVTTLCIVSAYQAIDRAVGETPARGQRRVRAQGLLPALGYLAIAAFGIGVAFAIGEPALGVGGVLVQLPVSVWLAFRCFSPEARASAADIERTRRELPARPVDDSSGRGDYMPASERTR
jgi:putative membrane protein